MKKISKTSLLIFSTICLFMLISSCKDTIVEPVAGSVTGRITYDMNDTTYGAKGIKVYLVYNDFKVDSVNTANNRKAFADSAVTDNNGYYKITSIQSGDYSVVPVPSILTQIFSLADDTKSFSIQIDEQKTAYTVNFTLPNPLFGQSNFLRLHINIKNAPALEENWKIGIAVRRYSFVFFVPFLMVDDSGTEIIEGSARYGDSSLYGTWYLRGTESVYWDFPYGFTSILYTLPNWFKISFFEVYSTKENPEKTYRNKYEFDYDFTLGNCPPEPRLLYDWKTHTLTRTN